MPDITREQIIEAMADAMDKKSRGLCQAPVGYATASLTAIEAIGLKIAPYEPTDAMLNHTMLSSMHRSITKDEKRDIYKWMLKGSPLYREEEK